MEFENPVSEALDGIQRRNDRLEQALMGLTRAMMLQQQVIAELHAHSQEHHEVINGHARILETLEALMIGGANADGN